VRLVPTARQPLRCILDPRLETPPTARLFEASAPVIVFTGIRDAARAAALAARGAEVVTLHAGPDGRIAPDAVLAELATRQVNELHIEAGARLNGALLAGGHVDELLLYLAPTLLGPGRDMAAFGPLGSLADGLAFEFVSAEPVGADLRILARRRPHEPRLS
jgi:diaminohydroxyphosphoribosylaminopyrimidine deaminase/5-amino-6-(5-phosphoribosylamino)uracil reductase